MKILGVCETPISIKMEHLEFSFVPFGRDIKKESKSLEKLLDVLDSDIINAVCYLHQNDIV